MARGDAADKGGNAQRLLEDPILREAFDAVEKDLVNAIASITLDGTDENMRMVVAKAADLQANRRLKGKLWQYITHGKLESREQEVREERRDPRWNY